MAGTVGGWSWVSSGKGKQELAPRQRGDPGSDKGRGFRAAFAHQTPKLPSVFSLLVLGGRTDPSLEGRGARVVAVWREMLSRYPLHPQITSVPRRLPTAGTTATSSSCTSSQRTRPSP